MVAIDFIPKISMVYPILSFLIYLIFLTTGQNQRFNILKEIFAIFRYIDRFNSHRMNVI